MTVRATTVAIGAVLAAACGSKPSGPPCDVRSDRLENVMRILSTQHNMFVQPKGMKVLDLPEGRQVSERGLALEVRANGDVSLMGSDVGRDRDALRTKFDAVREQSLFDIQRGFASDGATTIVYVLADVETTLGTLDAVLAAVPEDYELRLVGYGKPFELDVYQQELGDKPKAKKIDAEMTSEASSRATLLAGEMQKAMGHGCAPLAAAFGGVAGTGAEDKGAYMAREVPDALRKCKCDLDDPDLFEYLMYRLYGAYDRPERWIPLMRQHGLAEATVADLAR